MDLHPHASAPSLPSAGPRRRQLLGQAAALGGLLIAPGLRAAAPPAALRIGVAQPATGQPPTFGGSAFSVVHARGLLEEAFKADGIAVQWSFFKGAGPAINEALTNEQLDFALQGDLPALVARAAGLKTRLIAAVGTRANIYLAVPPNSSIQRVEDLRGKRVSIFKGTNLQLPINRVLEAHGLRERDVRAINLDTASAYAALAAGDLDAAFSGLDLLRLRDQGAARIVYTSRGQSPVFTRQAHLLVREAFQQRHPEAVQKVVDVLVRTAHWASDEKRRAEVLALWARAGTPAAHWDEDQLNEPLKLRLNPGFDPFLRARYRDAVVQAQHFKLTRSVFDTEQWIDPRFVDRALREQGLKDFWPPTPAV